MAVADTLNKAGYQVTVFDSAEYPGGILRYGIPDFKLEKWVVERRAKLLEREGVVFEMGVAVGEDISYRYLTKRFDALCLACGARKPRDLEVPGRDLKGIYFAMDYLVQQNKKIGGEPLDPAEEIVAEGKKVVVIGGGDTGSDCVGTALRQRAGDVLQLEILPKPPEKRADTTPWPLWPTILRDTHAHEEGGQRRWSVMTKAFLGESDKVKKLRCAEVVWEKPDGNRPPFPREKSGTEFEVEADLVLLAMGFVGPGENRIAEDLDLEKDPQGNIQADHSRMTSTEGIFVAGDMTLGQSLVVRAVADGRKAARSIIDYLEERRRKAKTE
jgi:glutamate synthase (NADPH/NADH) small chain